jgi:serine/threonine protein kinase
MDGERKLPLLTVQSRRQSDQETSSNQSNARNPAQKGAICKHLNHLFIFGFEACIPGSGTRKKAMMTEFVPNEPLTDHLLSNPSAVPLFLLRGDTRIEIVTAGIFIGMWHVHSRDFIHRDLNRIISCLIVIGSFESGISVRVLSLMNYNSFFRRKRKIAFRSLLDARYVPLEIHGNICTSKLDVFSFPLILCEIFTNKSGFSKD